MHESLKLARSGLGSLLTPGSVLPAKQCLSQFIFTTGGTHHILDRSYRTYLALTSLIFLRNFLSIIYK